MSIKRERISSLGILVVMGMPQIHRPCRSHTRVQTRTSFSIEIVRRVDEVSYNARQRSISKISQVHTNIPSNYDTDWTPIRFMTTEQREKNDPIDTRIPNKQPAPFSTISNRIIDTRSSTTNRPRTAWPIVCRYHSHPIQHPAIPDRIIRRGSIHRWNYPV